MASPYTLLDVAGKEVRLSNPDKVFFPALKTTKLDLVEYYLAVMDGVMTGVHERPSSMYRWPNGVDKPDDAFFQKRVPSARPEWLTTSLIRFPSGRKAEMLTLVDPAHVVWALNLGCIDFNPWPVRSDDLDHPDELRVDLDPTPDIPFADVRDIALLARDALDDYGLTGWPKTSGKRGIHIYCRIEPRWGFKEVRRAALALAREVESRSEGVATTAWWKEERRGVFVDYNQNARDRTIASVYSVRPVPEGRVSCALDWDEVPDIDPDELTIESVPQRFAAKPDPGGGIDDAVGTLDALLELSEVQEQSGLGEAPLPPHFPKEKGEPPRVQPSRRKRQES